jgi:hypothetical protein
MMILLSEAVQEWFYLSMAAISTRNEDRWFSETWWNKSEVPH